MSAVPVIQAAATAVQRPIAIIPTLVDTAAATCVYFLELS
jgi:hypothetical protein